MIKYHNCETAKRWIGYGFCCSSCHEDFEYDSNYDLCEIQIGNHHFNVCCTVCNDIAAKRVSLEND